MKKIAFYLSIGIIIALSFRFFSSLFYPALNSDNAVTVLMIHYFKLPNDLYFWGQDRLGSIIPLLGQIFNKWFHFSAIISESIVHYALLIIGFLCFASFIKSVFYKIVFAIVWFFPPMRMIDVTQFSFGIHYSFVAILCYLFDITDKESVKRNKILSHLIYLLIACLLIITVWVSDMALVSIFMLLSIILYFHIRKNYLTYNILKETLLYYLLFSAIAGYYFIRFAKSFSLIRNNYMVFSDLDTIFKTLIIFIKSISNFFAFKSNEFFTSIYSYLVVLIFILLIILFYRIKLDNRVKKVVLFFILDAVAMFVVIIISNWTYLNNVPRRYFTCTYIAVSFALVLLFDNLKINKQIGYFIKVLIFSTVLLGGAGTIYNLKYVWPKSFTPYVKIAGEFKKLGKIGLISEYWNSYIVSCTDPALIKATPNDQSYIRNYQLVEDVLKQDNIYVNRDMWMKTFPDTLHQFGRTLIIEGYPFRIGHSNVCKYKIIK